MKIPKKKKSICIIGGGFYGCYIAKKIKENFKNIKIEIYEKNTDLIAEVDSNQTSNVDFDTSTLEGFPTVYRDVKSIEGVEEFQKERSVKALHHFLKEAIAAKKKAHVRKDMHGGKRRKTKRRKTQKRRKSKRKKRKTRRRKKRR